MFTDGERYTGIKCYPTIITMTVISITLHLTDKGERTAFYKIYTNVYIKTQKQYIIIFF